jgi:hypothetical protein
MATRKVRACASGQLECVIRRPTNKQAATATAAKTMPPTNRRRLGVQAASARHLKAVNTRTGSVAVLALEMRK